MTVLNDYEHQFLFCCIMFNCKDKNIAGYLIVCVSINFCV
jgi:hypothetical protein